MCACVNTHRRCSFQNPACSVPKEPGWTMSGKPPSPGFVQLCLLGGKIPGEELAAAACSNTSRLLACEQPWRAQPRAPRGHAQRGPHRSPRAPALGRSERGRCLRWAEGRGGGSALGTGWMPVPRGPLQSQHLLKRVRSCPCANTGLSPAPPKCTALEEVLALVQPMGLCLLLQ